MPWLPMDNDAVCSTIVPPYRVRVVLLSATVQQYSQSVHTTVQQHCTAQSVWYRRSVTWK